MLSLQATEIRTHKTQLFILYFIVKMMTALGIEVLTENIFGKKTLDVANVHLLHNVQGKLFIVGIKLAYKNIRVCVWTSQFCGFFCTQGENGRKEELVTKEPSCPAVYRNSSLLHGQRVLLGLNNTLKVFPTKITDDGRVFSCHVLYHPERVQRSSTTVRVFGKELMPTALHLERTHLSGSEANNF